MKHPAGSVASPSGSEFPGKYFRGDFLERGFLNTDFLVKILFASAKKLYNGLDAKLLMIDD